MKIKNAEHITEYELKEALKRGDGIVHFKYTVSIIIMTFRRNSGAYILRDGESHLPYSWKYSLISVLFGWWGFPWGLIHTPEALFTNFSGGKDITQEINSFLNGTSESKEEQTEETNQNIAPMGLRLGAFAIDMVIMLMLISGFILLMFSTGSKPEIAPSVIFLGAVLYHLGSSVLEASTYRASIGKMILGLKVGTLTGGRISLGSSLLRGGIKFVPSLVFYVGHVLAFLAVQAKNFTIS